MCTYLVDGLAVTGADVPLHIVNLVRLRVDLVPPFEPVVVEVLCHLLFVLVQGGATPRGRPDRKYSSSVGRFRVFPDMNKAASEAVGVSNLRQQVGQRELDLCKQRFA